MEEKRSRLVYPYFERATPRAFIPIYSDRNGQYFGSRYEQILHQILDSCLKSNIKMEVKSYTRQDNR